MENKSIEISKKGIKVQVLTTVLIVVGVLVMAASIFVLQKVYTRYDGLRASFTHVEADRAAAIKFKNTSDYLTDQVRKYAVTGEIQYVDNYIEEKDILKNREDALKTIENRYSEGLELDLIKDAMAKSEELVVLEMQAIRLMESSDEASQSEAIKLLYSNDYQNLKERINWNVDSAIKLIEENSESTLIEDEYAMILIMNIASALVFLMFILLVLIFIFTTLLVVRPAKAFVKSLDKKEKLPEIGGYEFRKFARRYNDIYRSDRKNKELLREQGEIDELTGTLKVGTLELVRHNLSQSKEPLAIMMIDIDNFRTIKESHGYEMADKLVAKTAKLFTKSFKSSDYVIRTSQDEFELFLIRMTETDSALLSDRIAKINDKLKNTTDEIPSASVSVGVAFSKCGFDVEVERQADMALNYVKQNGRANCKIAE